MTQFTTSTVGILRLPSNGMRPGVMCVVGRAECDQGLWPLSSMHQVIVGLHVQPPDCVPVAGVQTVLLHHTTNAIPLRTPPAKRSAAIADR